MPLISLVVCLYKERDHLKRLLEEADGCFDDLIVVHDGPDEPTSSTASVGTTDPIDFAQPPVSTNWIISKSQSAPYSTPVGTLASLVEGYGGRYFEAPRAFQQEPHWPFAWSRAKYDWILRLDADESPSAEMREWLMEFRTKAEVPVGVSGYSCNWPLWDGRRPVTKRWPRGRVFLLNRRKVRFFGMAEQSPVPDTLFEELDLVLEHRPARKSYGFSNVLTRAQAYRWRGIIARSLLGSPLDLPRWRWEEDMWPRAWEEVRLHPLRTAISRLFLWSLYALRSQWRDERKVIPSAALNGGINHFLLCLAYLWMRIRR